MPWGRLPTLAHEPKGEYRPKPGNESLGDGGAFNAGVFIVKRQQDDRKCVEKRIKPAEIYSGAAEFEIFVLRELNHKHVTEYIDAFIDTSCNPPRASIYMEYCDLGTLADTLHTRRRENKPAKEWGVWELFIQLTNAVAYCQYGIHDAVFQPYGRRDTPWIGVVHRDIKPANIFLRKDYRSSFPHAVLGDFGQAIRQDDDGNWNRQYMGGDCNWAPPEAPDYDYDSDTWSVGVVVQAMCRLETDPPTIGPKRIFWGAGREYSKDLNDTIHTVMRTDPRDRPNLAKFAPSLDMMRHEVSHGLGVNSHEAKKAAHKPWAI